MNTKIYLGADVGGTCVKYALTDGCGHIISSGDVATDPNDAKATVELLGQTVGEFLGTEQKLAAAGLACAGIVNLTSGVLGRSPNLSGWENTNLHDLLTGSFGPIPVALANDVNAALVGEAHSGAGRNCSNLVMLALGTGVGGAVMLDSKLNVGAHNGAGEIGHIVLDLEGPVCACGSQGCLEAWAGSVGLLNRARWVAAGKDSLIHGDVTALQVLLSTRGESFCTRDLADLANADDVVAIEIFRQAGRRLGQAVAGLVNVLDPEKVIIGGGVAQAGDLLLDPCRKFVAKHVLAVEAATLPIIQAELGPAAAAVGAACLARDLDQNTEMDQNS